MSVKNITGYLKIEWNRNIKIKSTKMNNVPFRKLFPSNTRGLKNYVILGTNDFIHKHIEEKILVSVSQSTGAKYTNFNFVEVEEEYDDFCRFKWVEIP